VSMSVSVCECVGVCLHVCVHIAHLRQGCHNSKFGTFEILVYKETFANALLKGTVS
jgi:hypothetical protein